MDTITREIKLGTIGELLVQLRLLQYNVQAASALKDSGNYLIAKRDRAFRAIEVKTTKTPFFEKNGVSNYFHILAIVKLEGEEDQVYLDRSKIYLIPKECVQEVPSSLHGIQDFAISEELVESLFDENQWVL
ncbi:MAG: hypothetical protein ACE5I1_08210 [bacterium]